MLLLILLACCAITVFRYIGDMQNPTTQRFMWIAASILIGLGVLISIANWGILVNNLRGKKWSSAIPFMGGIIGAFGVSLLPMDEIWKFAWIPLLTDYGSIPVHLQTLIFLILRQPDNIQSDTNTE